MTRRTGLSVVAAAATLAAPSAALAEVSWATWTIPTEYPLSGTSGSYAPGTTGTVVDPGTSQTLNLTLSGEVYQTSSPSFSWSPYPLGSEAYVSPTSPTSPVGSSMIASTGATADEYKAHTLTFGQDVTNAVLALWSLGNPSSAPGQLTFSQPFIVLSDNDRLTPGGDATSGYTLTGTEGNGVIQFLGTYDQISWVVTGIEVWHGFTVGLTGDENPAVLPGWGDDPTIVPSWGTGVETYDLFAEGTGVTPPTQYVDPNAPIEPEPEPEPQPAPPPRMSVLERVLAGIDGATVAVPLGATFANIAENAGLPGTVIDGSILNTIQGLPGATASVGDRVAAVAAVTVDLGDMATTVLGAVNTGDITLGATQSLDEALAGTSRALSVSLTQTGGAGDTGALVLNVASNMTGVTGRIGTTMTAVNGSVGSLSTTVLGAVNTGTITSGVGAAVQGIVGLGI